MQRLDTMNFRQVFILLVLSFIISSSLSAQVTLTASSGPTSEPTSGSFTTLGEAFTAINAGTHQGAIVININASTTETASAVLNGSGSGSANYTTINIYPTTEGLSISGNLNFPLIDLNGADNVTIDGRVNATGITKSLTISNTSSSNTPGTSTIRFINDATANTVKYCTLKGSSMSTTAGIVFFSTTTATTGNDNNTIDNNNITMAGDTSRPVNVIYALGSSNKNNESNTISNNNIYDFLNKNIASNGINIVTYNATYIISGNSFYETASFTSNVSVNYKVISISTGSALGNGDGFTIANNYIGGSAPNCAGNAWTKTGLGNMFQAILLGNPDGTASSIQGNTIQNINWYNGVSSPFYGIYIQGNTVVNIGTITGNTIGATTGNASIQHTNNGTAASIVFTGIHLGNTGTTFCNNNIIGSITTANSNSTYHCHTYGIVKSNGSGTVTINSNTIGSTITSASINASSFSTNYGQGVAGILSFGTGTAEIKDNIIANLTNSTNNTDITSRGYSMGILVNGGNNTISGNTIRDLSNANANNTAPSSGPTYNSVTGIFINTATGTIQSIENNTIFNLFNRYDGFTGHVVGIFFYNAGQGPHTVSRNFIHSLSATGNSSSNAIISGIRTSSGTTTYASNVIRLGGNTSFNISGINENSTSGFTNKILFNTVYISGSLTTGDASKSYALYCNGTNNTRDFRNNILVNTRSTPSATSKHYAAWFNAIGGTFTCDYNNYYVSGTGGVLGYYGGDINSLPIVIGATGNDANSIATNPYFVDPSTTASGFSPTVPGTAVDGTGITVDFNNTTRTSPTFMGAIPSSPCTNPSSGGTIAAAQSGNAPFDPATFTNSAAPSGESGPLEYKWQSSTTSSSAGFSDIASSNAATYDAGALTQNTWFKRVARVGCKTDWSGAVESNVLKITVIKTWTGGSGNWSTASNWSDGVVPVSTDQFVINSGNPQLDVNFIVEGSLTLSDTGSLKINPGYTLSIAAGGVVDFGGKSVTLQSSAQGTAAIGQISGTLRNATKVTVERYIPNGKRAFRFLSAPVTTTTSIRQNWMEGATPGQWSSYPYTTTSTYNPNPGYGTQITGTGGATNGFDETLNNNPSLFNFNNSTGIWTAVTSTAGTIAAGTPYRMLVRGDRGYNMAANAEPAGGSTVLRTTGTLAQGQLTTGVELPALSQSADGWSLVGNPYPSVVDLYSSDVVKNNLTDYYYIWDPRQGSRGAYVAYNMTLSSNGSNNINSGMTRFLQPGQAFFVQNTSTAGGNSLVFREAAKGSASELTATFGSGTTGVDYSSLSAILYQTDSLALGRTSMDATRVLFGNRFSNAIEREDGQKFINPDETMSIKRGTNSLSMELRSRPESSTVVPLNISQYRQKRYTLRLFWDLPLQQDTLLAFLKDKYLGTETLINKTGTTDINYELDGQPASSAPDRFTVLFKSTVINVTNLTGTTELCVGRTAQLYNATPGGTWSSSDASIVSVDGTGSYRGLKVGSTKIAYTVSRYGVSKSVNQLVTVHAIPVQPTISRDADGYLISSSTTGNEWFSNNERISGVNAAQYKPTNPSYYRVRVVENGCVGEFSNSYYYAMGPMLDVEAGTFVKIFPNPVRSEIKIEFRLKEEESVRLQVFDLKGKQVLEQKALSTGSKINLGGLVPGVYRINVMNSKGIKLYAYTVVKQ